MNYLTFLKELDKRIEKYFQEQKDYICCGVGCSFCCEQGDYPMTAIELEYLMQGFIELDYSVKGLVKNNFDTMKKGGACPFLINNRCSVYKYRPIICRTYGLAYYYKDNHVKVPYCVTIGKNFSKIYKNGEIYIHPITENLDIQNLLKGYEIKSLYDWIKK